ncbi:MAG: SIS domain-containing protein [Promethearchaeota archaeon]
MSAKNEKIEFDNEDIEKKAAGILLIQNEAVNKLKIDKNMIAAIQKIIEYRNKNCRVITTGMGKAGIIAYKMSATMASIGIPSFFVSPAEAAHGDLGRIAPNDLVIVFSNSGRTGEVVSMITHLHELNSKTNYIITIGSSEHPEIPSDLVISYGQLKESSIVKKVPSTSTTIMLIIADILSITAAELLGFNDEWFKKRHPGGAIGASYKKEKS